MLAPPRSTSGFANNIQALRFAAASAVMLLHFGSPFTQAQGIALAPIFDPFKTFGNIGVDVFFVISGYVMYLSTINHHRPTDALPFVARRLGRIFLGYWPWLALFSFLVFGIAHSAAGQFNIVKSVLLLNIPGEMILPVSWSLVFEIQFYVVFAWTMMMSRRISVLLIALWGLSGVVNGLFWPVVPSWVTNPYVAEFAAGVLLAAGITRFGSPSPLLLLSIATLELLYTIHFFASFDLAERSFMFGGFATALVAGTAALEQRGMVAGRLLVLLGGASYTLYLCHVPIIFLTEYLFGGLERQWPSAVFAVLIFIVPAFSIAWFAIVERPVYDWQRRCIERWSAAWRARGTRLTA